LLCEVGLPPARHFRPKLLIYLFEHKSTEEATAHIEIAI
jgi:hypothetical protein